MLARLFRAGIGTTKELTTRGSWLSGPAQRECKKRAEKTSKHRMIYWPLNYQPVQSGGCVPMKVHPSHRIRASLEHSASCNRKENFKQYGSPEHDEHLSHIILSRKERALVLGVANVRRKRQAVIAQCTTVAQRKRVQPNASSKRM